MEGEPVQEEMPDEQVHPHTYQDDHHHRAHHPHTAIVRGILASFLLFTLVMFGVLGYLTNAPFGNVLFAFAPSIIIAIVGFGMLNKDMFDIKFLSLTCIVSIVIVSAIVAFTLPSIDLTALIAINIVLNSLLIFILSHAYDDPIAKEPEKEQQEQPITEEEIEEQLELPQIFTHLSENCKALNVVIGRVYNLHYGTTKKMREKIKIDPEWYQKLLEETDPELLIGVVRSIQARAELLAKPENQIFTDDEVGRLHGLMREDEGMSSVADVLQQNTDRPVEQFRQATIHYCELALQDLRL